MCEVLNFIGWTQLELIGNLLSIQLIEHIRRREERGDSQRRGLDKINEVVVVSVASSR